MLEWDDLRTFLAIARAGTLSGAARALGLTQPTMGRRLTALQQRIGARLLQRTPGGFRLTDAGERILASVERMEVEALAVERAVSGEDARLEGVVRLTSVGSFGVQFLTPLFARVREAHPGIAIEFVVDARALSLARREADIAIRLARFDGHEIVSRKLGDVAFALYASPDYLRRYGMPDMRDHGRGHAIVTVQDDQAGLAEIAWFARIASEAAVALRSNSRAVQMTAAREGMGLACLPRPFADEIEGLTRIPVPHDPPPVRELWAGVHRDMRSNPRIRAVLDTLYAGLAEKAHILAPRD